MRGSNICSTARISIYTQVDNRTLQASIKRSVIALSCGVALTAFAALTGCASAPIPTEQLAVSKAAVDSATTAGGTEFAPLELKAAHDKLDAANQAVTNKEYDKAAALASEAQVDAKLAETKALSAKAQKSVAETQDSLRSMVHEINRNSTQQQQEQQQQQQLQQDQHAK